MATWQRYSRAWTPKEEAAARNVATAPSLGYEEKEEKKEDSQFDRGRDAQRPLHTQQYHPRVPPYQQEQARLQFQGYPPMPPQGYAGYSHGVQERQEQYDPMLHGAQWTYQGPQAPGQQPMSVRGQWVALNQQQNRQGLWTEGPEALQQNERHRHWGRRLGSPSLRSRTPGFVMATLRLCVYHALNVIFALVACGILSAGICTAASLIPVCCVGLLIFQVLVYIVFSMAQWDIKLGNFIAPAHQCAYSTLPPPGRFIGREGLSEYRISPSLAFFSPLSLIAMLYFVLVKPVIGALSLLSVLLVIAPTVSFITSLTSHYQGEYYDSIQIYGVGPTSMSRYPGLSLVGAICVTLLGVALMQLVAKISLGATRFFCCEKFAMTTRFAPYQFQPLTNNGVASYGTASMRNFQAS
ncbi:hypothetical protein PI124_g1070 [Phytophthora idaei]|nr:hypothetical protein PI125_g1380 [Phytophthora idaei]KAG3170666.1 hypothetical protein PI126_g2236 [Phytophthora idaei]KAG3254378.1 hypothetical protein PI124_g1070 [Phytophthora idaei]